MKKREEESRCEKIIYVQPVNPKEPKFLQTIGPKWLQKKLIGIKLCVFPKLQPKTHVKKLGIDRIALFRIKTKELIKALRKAGKDKAANWYVKNVEQENLFLSRGEVEILEGDR